jgi:hypothetical protein
MGLDHWLEAYNPADSENEETQIGTPWRKWWKLQDHMERLWRERTGSDKIFNCVRFELTAVDLDDLEEWILENQNSAYSCGAFDDSDAENDTFKTENMETLQEARMFLEENPGFVICYNSWW